jgi:hypothetical protein
VEWGWWGGEAEELVRWDGLYMTNIPWEKQGGRYVLGVSGLTTNRLDRAGDRINFWTWVGPGWGGWMLRLDTPTKDISTHVDATTA